MKVSIRASDTHAVLPSYCARRAAAKAVEPEPRMTRSKCDAGIDDENDSDKHPLILIIRAVG
jgi:hypothetical protein